LTPSDYHLFPNLKKFLHGKHFESEEEIKFEIGRWASSPSEKFFEQGIDVLLARSKRCIELGGEYVLGLLTYHFIYIINLNVPILQ
jgi:hypothetical protein